MDILVKRGVSRSREGRPVTDNKRKLGRPALPSNEKLVVVPVRLTPAQREKLQRIGVWRLRDWLDRVREPSA